MEFVYRRIILVFLYNYALNKIEGTLFIYHINQIIIHLVEVVVFHLYLKAMLLITMLLLMIVHFMETEHHEVVAYLWN